MTRSPYHAAQGGFQSLLMIDIRFKQHIEPFHHYRRQGALLIQDIRVAGQLVDVVPRTPQFRAYAIQ